MLKIKNLKVDYGKFTALNINKEVNIEEQDIVGVIGGNGAGKSTLIKALTNQVKYEGELEKPKSVAVHLQDNAYPTTVSCQTILEGLLKTSYKKNTKLIDLVQFFDFEKNLKKKFSQLSGGQKQRLTMIMVLYQDAALTCFDEMSTGLDFETRSQLMKKIQEWYADKPATLLLITHYFDELEHLAKKLLIIEKGQLVDFGGLDDMFKKYVGYSAIVIESEKKSDFESYKVIEGEDGKVALACQNLAEQQIIADSLVKQGYKFMITNTNVELIYLNALAQAGMTREKA
ncbi:ABC transporter ATP-binding protein [Lactococcus lactis]|uniref:ABC transporter ATP-binding protein n=1 Tax=Lactococcus lactis TaxID=1358 RepID=A0ABD5GLV0_9LACT|nr:ABC transporter ATP-binding protein [Lactococcus lactis]MDN6544615.1 ABC transporter ATP-binding protein [Enterococcaceae bacterium]MDQ7158933.1 ABC transporter ATP-binding protein [Lactococcus lactis]MDV2618193.1 ABC transporter ATP-binding protein [Lactococcus lactis]